MTNEKVAIAFDKQSLEILNNIYPELRNAAVNIAVKMLAKDPMYKKYFCIKCDDIEIDESLVAPEQINNAQSNNTQSQPAQPQVVDWNDFI